MTRRGRLLMRRGQRRRRGGTLLRVWLEHFTIIVDDYDRAIEFFTGALGFELAEDSPALTTEGGRPKRWVVVHPPGAQTGVLLAQADGPRQAAAVGNQAAGRVGFFLRVDDFDAAYERMTAAGVTALHVHLDSIERVRVAGRLRLGLGGI